MTNKITIHALVQTHLKHHFGKVKELALKEIIGDLTIHVIPSSPERDYIILSTSGAKLSNEQEHYELLMYLPENWNLTDFNDLTQYWPIAWLRKIAYYDGMVSPENTFSNEETYEPLAPNIQWSGFLILPEPCEYGKIGRHKGKAVSFLNVIPLYKEEIELKQKAGTNELLERFQRNGITMVLDLDRPNVGLI